MKKFRSILIHFLLIAGIFMVAFSSVIVYKNNPEAKKIMEQFNKNFNYEMIIKSAIFNFLWITAVIYTFYYFIFNFLFRSKVKAKQAILSILIYTSLIVILLIGAEYFFHQPINAQYLINNIVFSMVIGGIGLGARALIEFFNDKEKKKELEQKNLQSELNLLRSQINPHFLFNTLNNIDALIGKDAEKASELLIKLSVQMRYMLYDSNTEKIDLSSEIEFIKDYIALQKLRIRNQEAVETEFNGQFKDLMVPPMLFIPFIENAFKHCCDTTINKAIVFKIIANENEIRFESKNLFEDDSKGSKDKTGGIGVELAKKRLKLLYPEKHIIDIKKENNWYLVSLKISLNDN